MEISKLNHKGSYDDLKYGIKVEIQSLKAIEVNGSHGIEIMARAWKGTKQLGFGDGSVEIERFRIFNPPIFVPDPLGNIGITYKTIERGNVIEKYREDPIKAIQQDLAHTIKIVGKENSQIVIGKVGNTTSTFYPNDEPTSTSCNGYTQRTGVNENWATIRAGAGTGATIATAGEEFFQFRATTTANQYDYLQRSNFLFDTSAIPDTDNVDSATFSLVGQGDKALAMGIATAVVRASTPASNTALVNADYNQYGSTALSNDFTLSGWVATGDVYNDFTINATGLATISKTGITKWAATAVQDLADSPTPTWASGGNTYVGCKFSNTADTTSDPKLVVVHSAAAANSAFLTFMGPQPQQ